MALSQKLKTLRAEKKMSQEKVARESGMALSYYRALETGAYKNPTLDVLTKLADTLKISIDELIGRKAPKKK